MNKFLFFIFGVSVTLNLLVVFLLILKKEKIILFNKVLDKSPKITRSEDNFSQAWSDFWR